ncbi:putative ribonuclease H-like domain-containing protein [Tanacetum coccineum]|uniref:Ribonuclease H-like domain-containing protein n=1 Tax=Tanacetum coccineum TaxID=301880 RepID=A0ABQ5AXI4_9ASTR
MWRLRIEQYFQVQDYALWDVIENGNSFKLVAQTTTNADGTLTSLIPDPYKDAKTLFAAIQTIFGDNEAIKKTQKTLLKQMNKHDLDTMSFNDLYNNFKIIEQEVKGTASSSSSLSSHYMAFVSFPSSTNEVNTAYGVSTATTQVSPASTQVSTTSTQVSTTNLSDDTVYAFLASQSNGSQLVYEDLEKIHKDDIEEMDLKWQLALLSMMTRRFFQKTGRKITINGGNTVGYDKSMVECFNCHKMGHFARECKGPRNQGSRNRNQDSSRKTVNVEETSSKSMVAIDGAGFDWSYMANDEVPTNMALMAFSDFEPEFEGYRPKTSKNVSEDMSNKVKESLDTPLVKELVSDDKLEKKTVFLTVAKIEFVRPKQQEKPVRKPVKYAEIYRPNSAVVNAVKASACWVWRPTKLNSASITLKRHNYGHPQKEDQGYVDSGCSRHMTGNMSYLSDFKEFNGGYVTFGGGAKGGKITADESQVLLKVPRKNNMYSVDMKNIVPKESLTCLAAKAKLDESMIYHRRFTWVFFLATKDETSGILKRFITEIENLVDKKVKIIRCDNGTEFKNRVMSEFCEQKGIKREFSVARTPQQNSVAERRNKTLIEAARTMLADSKLPTTFWAEAVNTACYVQNRVQKKVLVQNANNDELQPSSDAEKKDNEGVCKQSGIADQKKPENNTQGVNTVGPSINIELDMFSLEDNATATHVDFFGDETEVDMSNITTTYPVLSTPNTRIHKDHLLDHVIGDVQFGVLTRRMRKTTNKQGFISVVSEGKTHEDLHTCLFACFLSQEEPKKIIQALKDLSWIEAMQEELLQFKLQQGYTQEEGIDYDEVFAPVDRIEAIRLFLAYASFKDFVEYQMDVKSAFLYGKIEEEVYVCQPPGFEDPEFPNIVYKVEKALYGLHQAPRAWYETLSTYLLDNGFQREVSDEFYGFSTVKTASTPMETSKPLLKDAEAEDVDVHLYRSMIGSLMYLTSSRPDIMFVVCACARFQVTPKVSHLHAVKRIFRYLKGQSKLGFVANSTTEAEYVAAASCCRQVLWIQNQMLDYGYNFMNTKIFIDNESTICIVKNLVFHSKTKHIEIRHHFIRDSNEKKLIQMIKIHTDQNVTDLLTKAFDDTAKAKTINGEVQIQALVDGKKVIVTETSVRRALQLKDAEVLRLLLGMNSVALWPQLSSVLPQTKKFNFSKYIFDNMVKNFEGGVKFLMYPRLGAQEDASKQGRKIADLDADAEVTLVDEAQRRIDHNLIFDTGVFDEQEVEVEKDDTQSMMEADYELLKLKQKSGRVEIKNDSKTVYTKVVEGSKSQAEGSKKRTREELKSDNSKKQKIDDNIEAEVDDEAEMKKLIKIVLGDEVAIGAIPLATKSPIIVDWKIIKEGKMGYFQIIRADGSSRRYSSMIRMLQNIDRENLETLWKLVKAKHGNTKPEEAYERVLWGDLKVMFEPDVESEVWRNL